MKRELLKTGVNRRMEGAMFSSQPIDMAKVKEAKYFHSIDGDEFSPENSDKCDDVGDQEPSISDMKNVNNIINHQLHS